MLTSLHEGVLLNGTPFTDVSQLAAVKHEADFCPVCPDGVCTWVIRTREWYIELGMVRLEREANLVNPRIAALNRAHAQAIRASRKLNADPLPVNIFGLRTKVRKGINAADAKFQAEQHRQFLTTVHTVTLTVDTGAESFVEEDEFFAQQEAVITASAVEIVQQAAGKALKAEGYKLTPKQAKRARKNSNKGISSKPRNTRKCRKSTRKVINIVTVLVNIHRENLRQVKLTARRELRTFRTNSLSLMHFEDFIGSLSVSFDVSVPWMNYLEGR